MVKYITLIILACVLVGVDLINAADAPLRFKIPGDSLRIRSGQDLSAYPLSAVKDNDTVRVWEIEAFTIYSAADSLVVKKTARYVPVTLETPERALKLYIWFDSSSDQIIRFVDTLRQYPNFGHTAVPAELSFAYSPSDDSNLVELREKYHLDKVAGNGPEVSRIINLMKWAHKIVPHDGSSFNPSPRNALNIIQVCADSNRGVNCRMLATVLNEAYLACGFMSRHLTCMPRDKEDTDCHVINMVWSDSLGKWIYMDPSFQGYFMDAKGVLLSPMEVRYALINGDSLILNDDLDHNGQPHDPLQYRSYMAKNLFRFLTPLESEFGYESKYGVVEWVNLNPVGYDAELLGTADSSETSRGEFIDFYTDNAEWFWGR